MKQRIEIGLITKPQGLKGEVKINLYTDEKNLANLSQIYVNGIKYDVQQFTKRVNGYFLKLKFVDNRDQSELLRGAKLEVERDAIFLSADEYFIDDLIGLNVVTQSGDVLGKITEVNQFGAADVFTCVGRYGSFDFPYLDDVVLNVEVGNGKVIVDEKRLEEVKV